MQKLAVFMVGGLFTAPDNQDIQIALAKRRPASKELRSPATWLPRQTRPRSLRL